MRRVLLLLLVFTVAWAHDYPLADIQPGLRGHALTAVAGNEIVSLPLEIIAVQDAQVAGEPLILVQLSGEHIEAFGGVASGMSGSPVYITVHGQDRLVGAIGYTFPNADGYYGMVTPINQMRTQTGGAPLGQRTQLLMSGSNRSVAVLEEHLGPFSVAQAGTTQTSDAAPELVPGSAIAVSLATGDVTIAAIGTVTAIDGDDVLLLGHPFFNLGDVDYALQPVTITAVIPSRDVPFKLGNVHADIIGAATRDVPAGVSGTLHQAPAHFPVNVRIHGTRGEHRHSLNVTSDERLTAPVLHAALLELFDRALLSERGGSAEIAWTITLAGYHDAIEMREFAASTADIAALAAEYGATPSWLLAMNEFRDYTITGMEIAVTFSDHAQVGRVAKIVPPAAALEPGATVDINVRFQPYRGEAVVRSIPVALPDDVTGELLLLFRGGSVPRPEQYDTEKNPITRDFQPRSFGEYLTSLQDHIQSTEFIIEYESAPGDWERLARITLPFAITSVDELTLFVPESEGSE